MYENIFVSRISNICENSSFMKTTKVLDVISGDKLYDIQLNIENTENIKYVEIDGDWINFNLNLNEFNLNESNILGGIGILKTDKELLIPVNEGLKEYFMYYNCFLLETDDKIIFDSKDMPLFEMNIGKDYFENYILNKDYANGMYIEYHNTPHYYISGENSEGFIVLGKKINNKYKLSAIKIPKNKALYIPPYVLHNDCGLIGEYKVMYNLAEDFSTVRLVDRNNPDEFTKIIFY